MENNLHITTVVKGKISIPKTVRLKLNIKDGDYILITLSENYFSCRKVDRDKLKMLLDTVENGEK